MANPWLNLYNNNPTAGGTDGTAVSTGDYSNSISFNLDASQTETKVQPLAIRTESGYMAKSGTTISETSDTSDFWKLSLDNVNWSDTIVFSDTITATNTLFYIKASSATTENPSRDRDVKFRVVADIEAVT